MKGFDFATLSDIVAFIALVLGAFSTWKVLTTKANLIYHVKLEDWTVRTPDPANQPRGRINCSISLEVSNKGSRPTSIKRAKQYSVDVVMK